MHPQVNHETASDSPASTSSEFVKRYLGIISLITSLLIVGIFWGFYSRTTHLIHDQLLYEARAFFEEIVQTRHWIINQEGVYTKDRPDMPLDPRLEQIQGLKTTIIDGDGDHYVLRNHAVITRMISALAQKNQDFIIDITSLNPLNPDNQPDPFERAALEKFAAGTQEFYLLQDSPTGPLFRYMAPLLTQNECLPCHGAQGYRLGDIRGGISISIPAQRVIREITKARIYTIIAAITLLSLLLSVIIYISHHLVKDLKKSERRLVELATIDSLTGILNRGEGLRRFQQEISRSLRKQQPMAIILIDIDYFKRINDNYGHQVGDRVLQTVAANLSAALRNYDIICRYGGEEFLIVLPATERHKALETAERLRLVIAEKSTETGDGKTIKLTISLGVSSLQPGDSLDGLVYRADNALYIAKEEGRNQVQFIA